MVWFTCSATRCEVKAERLVELHHSMVGLTLNRLQLPEGWSERSDARVGADDDGKTFCPVHAKRLGGGPLGP